MYVVHVLVVSARIQMFGFVLEQMEESIEW